MDVRSKVSDDGNTMTDEVTDRSKDGKEAKSKWVWHRIHEKEVAGAGAHAHAGDETQH